MKKIASKEKYLDLLKVFLSVDFSGDKSLVKTVMFNKMINYLYLKLADDKKSEMLEMLKNGVNEQFFVFMSENLTKEDLENIAKATDQEVMQIYNQALITNTNGS